MSCSICTEPFNAGERRPKVLPCGHSFCLECLRRLPRKLCPKDRKAFRGTAESLPDNFMLLEVCERAAPVAAARSWCRDCSREAAELCLDEHSVCSLKKARADRVAPRLDALQAGEAALRGLRRELDDSADGLDAELAGSRGHLVDALDAMDRARQQLQAAVEADEAVLEEASKAAGLDGLARDAARLLPALGDPASSCSVSLQGPSGAWTASVRPRQRPAARLLLCQLLCAGELRREGQGDDCDDQTDGEALPADAQHWQEKSNAIELDHEAMSWRMQQGRRVVRGADWPQGSTADGQPPRPGTVVKKEGGNVTVEWDFGGSGTYAMGLERAGKKVYQLKLLPRTLLFRGIVGVKNDSPEWIDVLNVSCALDVNKKADLLADLRLDQALVLLNLHCDVAPAWSKQVLQKVAPHLLGLGLVAPDVEHLRIAQTMPKLRALLLSSVDTELMQMALSMPGLGGLEAHCPFEAPLGALRLPEESKMTWLALGVYPLSAALAVVRAHAATLKDLWLVAASKEPYGCPDLAAELRRCGLKKLEGLCLCRESHVHFCQHDIHSCKEQKLALFDMFVAAGMTVKVSCHVCG